MEMSTKGTNWEESTDSFLLWRVFVWEDNIAGGEGCCSLVARLAKLPLSQSLGPRGHSSSSFSQSDLKDVLELEADFGK